MRDIKFASYSKPTPSARTRKTSSEEGKSSDTGDELPSTYGSDNFESRMEQLIKDTDDGDGDDDDNQEETKEDSPTSQASNAGPIIPYGNLFQSPASPTKDGSQPKTPSDGNLFAVPDKGSTEMSSPTFSFAGLASTTPKEEEEKEPATGDTEANPPETPQIFSFGTLLSSPSTFVPPEMSDNDDNGDDNGDDECVVYTRDEEEDDDSNFPVVRFAGLPEKPPELTLETLSRHSLDMIDFEDMESDEQHATESDEHVVESGEDDEEEEEESEEDDEEDETDDSSATTPTLPEHVDSGSIDPDDSGYDEELEFDASETTSESETSSSEDDEENEEEEEEKEEEEYVEDPALEHALILGMEKAKEHYREEELKSTPRVSTTNVDGIPDTVVLSSASEETKRLEVEDDPVRDMMKPSPITGSNVNGSKPASSEDKQLQPTPLPRPEETNPSRDSSEEGVAPTRIKQAATLAALTSTPTENDENEQANGPLQVTSSMPSQVQTQEESRSAASRQSRHTNEDNGEDEYAYEEVPLDEQDLEQGGSQPVLLPTYSTSEDEEDYASPGKSDPQSDPKASDARSVDNTSKQDSEYQLGVGWVFLVLLLAWILLAAAIATPIIFSRLDRKELPATMVPTPPSETFPPLVPPTLSPSPTFSRMPSMPPPSQTFPPLVPPTLSPSPSLSRMPSMPPVTTTQSPTMEPSFTVAPEPTPQTSSPNPSIATSSPSSSPIPPTGAPGNDVCQTAIGPLIPGDAPISGTITGAGANPVDICGGVQTQGPGVWYTTIGTGAEMMAHTCVNTNFDSKITIFKGDCEKPLCIEANDNACGAAGSLSAVSWFSEYNQVYHILVHGEPSFSGDDRFDLTILSRYNDECSTAVGPLAVHHANQKPISVEGDTFSATPNEIVCNGELNQSPSVYYLVRGTGGTMTASVCQSDGAGNNFTPFISLLIGDCSFGAPSEGLECLDRSQPNDCELTWESVAFQDYFILIHGETEFDIGGFTLEVSTLQVPTNEACDRALGPVPLDGSLIRGTTAGAEIPQEAPFCLSGVTAPGVWYLVQGTGRTLQASLCDGDGSSNSIFGGFDTRLSVYGGECPSPDGGGEDFLTCVEGNDDFCGTQSLVTWLAEEGVEYYLLVHGYQDAVGDFALRVTSLG